MLVPIWIVAALAAGCVFTAGVCVGEHNAQHQLRQAKRPTLTLLRD